MRNSFVVSIFAMALFAVSPLMLAQTSPQSGASKTQNAAKGQSTASPQDLSGVWGIFVPVRQRAKARSFSEAPPMTPWAAEHYKVLNEAAKRGNEAMDVMDPIITACAPPGLIRLTTFGRPFEIIQIPGRVMIVFEWDHWVQYIWTDGRGHPTEVDPTWMGHSIGHWDGDTLVVDTVGLNDMTLIDKGHPHSEDLRVSERFRRVNHGTLELSLTYEDPKVYTKPWTGKITFTLDPQGGPLLEWVACEERITREAKKDPCQGQVMWELVAACKERETPPGEK